jgi:hypothetical protein
LKKEILLGHAEGKITVSFPKKVRGSHKVYQLLAYGRWFFPGTPASSTTKTGRHDIAEWH